MKKQYKIKDIGKVVTGKTPSTKRSENFSTAGTPFITPTDYKEEGRYVEPKRFISKDTTEAMPSIVIPKNSIMVTCIGSDMGKSAIAQGECITNQQINSIIINNNIVDYRYIYYLLTTQRGALRKLADGSGSTMPIINKTDFENIELTLPPLSEQKRISNILSSFDNKIEILKKENKILEDIAENIFKEWFVKYNFPNKDGKPYRDSNGKMIDSELGPIPDGWRIGKLGETIECFDSQRVPLPNEERAKRKGQYPYYGATEIMDYINDYIFDGKYLLLAEDGSVQTERGYPILQLVKGQFWANNHTHVLQGKGSVSTEYLYLLMTRFNITSIITGAVQPKINQRNLLNLDIVIPTENLLKTFEEMSSSAFEKIFINNYNIANLDKIKTALLNKLII